MQYLQLDELNGEYYVHRQLQVMLFLQQQSKQESKRFLWNILYRETEFRKIIYCLNKVVWSKDLQDTNMHVCMSLWSSDLYCNWTFKTWIAFVDVCGCRVCVSHDILSELAVCVSAWAMVPTLTAWASHV